jgi:hypothetical protein
VSALDLTLVCYYGEKPTPLAALLQSLVKLLAERWGMAFEPYSFRQMHATLIGLETDIVDGARVNRWFWRHRGERRVPNAERLVELLETTPRLPFRVRFGGFQADQDYPFTSRGQRAYQRMFQRSGDQVVLMGWPETDGAFPETVTDLRRDFESANLLHKYHARPLHDADNDLFLVLGRLDRSLPLAADIASVESEARELMATSPTWVEVDRDALTLVAYADARLPEGKCQCWRAVPAELRSALEAAGWVS